MECGNCRHHNEAGAKFCGECGAPLVTRCSTCDADQPPGAKFCNQCGTPMAAAGSPPIEDDHVAAAAVRKQVTALFADLVGSTAFGEQVDPEVVRAALGPYFEILQSTIEGHAGTVVKFTGDGVMAIFGIPEVSEDDALRAVAAGVELQRRFRAFADSVRERHGVELGLRVGVNTGELVIGDGDADLVGDVLNTAARLESACEPGRVMVGEDTWRLSRSVVRYEVLGKVRVKGKADALATFQVVDDDESTVDTTTPFVGRGAELGVLREVFDDAVASSAARLVTVIGAPGVGKTRLAAELRGGHDVRSFDLRFERRGSTTFTPIVELLRELTRSGSADDVALLVAGHPEASRLAPVLASMLGHGEARTTEESFWAVRRLLEHLATDEPLVVVVDDIQWAEPLFWDLLDHLVEWTAAPVLLVALARPELRELRVELTQAGRRVAASIVLEGLDADTTRELAARLLDTDELPTELVERIPESTEGNPLFVRELMLMLVDDGVLARAGDRWQLTIDADAIEVPPTVLSLLASRVERLADDERHVVELASVIGTEFDRGLLDAISGREVGARLGATIDRLRRKDLIEPSGAWAGDQPIYRFHHVLVRDAAYRRLLKGHRADLHQRVGQYVDGLEQTGDDADVVVAYHYEQAHRYRAELGTLDDATRALASDAARRLHVAARRTLDRDDPTAAGGFAERALALTADAAQRGELLLLGCESLFASGDVARGAALVDSMGDHADRDDRFDAWADCYRAQLWSLTDADRLEEAELLADDAARRLDALEDLAGVAKARLVRAACLARLGRVGDCEDELDLALAAARAASDRRRTVAVLGAAPLAALWGPSPVARAGGRCLDVLRLLRITTESPAVEATSVRCQGMLEALRGRLDSARTKLEQSRSTAREIGLRQGLFETELFAGLVELLDGDPVAAEPHLRAARDGLGRLGIGADAGQAAALLGRVLLVQGRVDDADELATEALASAGQNLQTAMAARAVMAEVRSAQGRHDEAASLIAEAIEIAERTDVIVDHALVELAGIAVANAAGDETAARRHRDRALHLLDAKGVTLDLAVGTAEPESSTTTAEPTPTTVAPSVPTAPENAATRVGRRVTDALSDGDRAAFIRGHHADAEIVMNLPLSDSVFAHDTLDVEGWVDVTFNMPDDEAAVLTPLAIRGDDMCLDRLDLFSADRTTDAMYVVFRLDERKIIRVEVFGSDQLWDAIDRLDELWLGPGMTVGARTGNYRAVASGDPTAMRSFLAEDFESIDHGRLGLVVRDRETYVDSLTPIDGEPWVTVPVEIVRHELRGDHVVELNRVSARAGDSVVDTLMVLVSRGSTVIRADNFDIDDDRAAHLRADELLAGISTGPHGAAAEADDGPGHELRNAASEILDETATLRTRADVDAVRDRFHHDFVGRHRWRVFAAVDDMDRDDYLEVIGGVLDVGGRYETSVVAIRGDDVALGRLRIVIGDDVSERLVGIRLSDDLVSEAVAFEAEDLHEALDWLDRSDVELHGRSELVGLVQRCRHGHVAGDRDALRLVLAPDWHIDDRRTLGMGEVDRERYLRSSVRPGTTYLLQALLDHADGATLTRERWIAHDGSHWDQLNVSTYGDGVYQSVVLFDPDDHRRARALFDEVAGQIGAPSDVRTLENAATRLAERALACFGRVDRAGCEALTHEDLVIHSLMRFRTADRFDRTGFLDQWFALANREGSPTEVSSTALAIRGDTVCLTEDSVRIGDDVNVALAIYRVEHGRVAELWYLDREDLHDALDLLDQLRFDDGLDPMNAQLGSRYRRALASGTVDDFRATVTDDYMMRDHRRLGLGVRDIDEYLASSGELFGTSEMVVTELLHWDGPVVLCRFTFGVRGFYQPADIQNLGIQVRRGDKIAVQESFDADDLDTARARFRELVDDYHAARHGLTNRATELFAEAHRLFGAGDRDRWRAVFAEDFVATTRERLAPDTAPLSRDEYVRTVHELRGVDAPDTASSSASYDIVAVRGDHLCAVRITLLIDGYELFKLFVVETNDELIEQYVSFDPDQLHDALDLLNELWTPDGLDPIYGEVESRYRQVFASGTVDDFRALATDDFVFRDHRKLGLGVRSLDEYVASSGDFFGCSEMIITEVMDWAGPVVLLRTTFRLPGDDQIADPQLLSVVANRDDKLAIQEPFDPDDLDAARARFDELVAEHPGSSQPTPGRQAMAIHAARSAASARLGAPPVHTTATTTVAVRGDALALVSVLPADGDTAPRGALGLAEVADDGSVVFAADFAAADLNEALDAIDERWIALGADAGFVRFSQRLRYLNWEGDADEFRRVTAGDFFFDDHRKLGVGRMDRDQYLTTSFAPGVRFVHVEVIEVGERAALTHDRFVGPNGDEWEQLAVMSHRSGSLVGIDLFDLDDLDGAQARLREVIAGPAGAGAADGT